MMHRLPVGALLIGALVVGNSLLVGCRPRTEPPADTAAQPARASQTAVQAGHSEQLAESAGQPTDAAPTSASPAGLAQDRKAAAVSGEQVRDQAEAAENVDTASPEPEMSWSKQRLVLLAPGGPRIIDLRVNVGGSDLPEGLAGATEWLSKQLEFDLAEPIAWEALLEKPLVQSGWLGNLIPSDEQRAELLSMYDKENVGTVDTAEFQAFMTRGLSRRPQIRVVQGPAEARLVRSRSPWGPLDRDGDDQLSQEELSHFGEALLHFDFDGDGTITQSELRSTSESMTGAGSMERSRGLLDVKLVLATDPAEPAEVQRTVLEQYTFADAISREQFYHWDDRRWRALGGDESSELTKRDLAGLTELIADAEVDVVMPTSVIEALPEPADRSDGSVSTNAPPHPGGGDEPQPIRWSANATGGRLSLPGCLVVVRLRDDYSRQARRLAIQQFTRARDDAAVAAALAGALELKDGAWELVRERGPAGPSRAWGWLVAPRHFRVTVSWVSVEAPWFELLDADGDRRLTALEISGFQTATRPWDRNLNDKLEEEEMPLVVSLTVAREDNRLANFLLGGMIAEKGGGNTLPTPPWFTGMDYNSDGELTHGEFLGEDASFEALDADGDGIIEAREVYAPH